MSTTPHIRDGFAPLNELIKRAIRRFGDFTDLAVGENVQMMFVEFANQVVDDYVNHPYFDGRAGVVHYVSDTEARPIPDQIMLSGLLAHYSFQQASEKTPGYQTLYFRTMNQIMWQELNGNTAINLRPTDGGSNKAHSVVTGPVNGLPVVEDSGVE